MSRAGATCLVRDQFVSGGISFSRAGAICLVRDQFVSGGISLPRAESVCLGRGQFARARSVCFGRDQFVSGGIISPGHDSVPVSRSESLYIYDFSSWDDFHPVRIQLERFSYKWALKAHANGRNILGQQHKTLLDPTCCVH